ncbi:MAG: DNA polymerase/3'-5' exonuclease PolX [Planctomycetota bacterium]|nr:MAG: DNA polymerase/3'-5' exonuclease PolX [Planctomycetota bacterium]
MTNADVAALFEHLADLLEYEGENQFRIRAYRSAARTIAAETESLAAIRHSTTRSLADLEGIGRDLAGKIETILESGRLPALDELSARVPAVVFDLFRIPGLGPKKVRQLVQSLGIDSLDGLEAACRAGLVRGMRGFGEKTEASILKNLAFVRSTVQERLLWEEADAILARLLVWMESCPGLDRIEGAGSWRRGCETVGDIDVLAISLSPATVMDHFHHWQETSEVIAAGDTKSSIRGPGGVQIDLRVIPPASFGAAWQYFTGSKEHNIRVRSRARERGLSLNEYGIHSLVVTPDVFPTLPAATEEDVYSAVGLPWIPPELREGRGEIHLAAEGLLPALITVADIRGDLHMHTTDTDGEDTLAEMVRGAIERGLEYIAITDHSQRVTMAHGLDETRLRRQWERIDLLNEALAADGASPIVVLKGIEVDMLEKGGLDLPDRVLEDAEWVVASLHYGQGQPRAQITSRILEAVEHPAVSVIGHPTGRLINRRPAYDVDMEAVVEAAARTGTFLEINATPRRLDLNDLHAAAAQRAGVAIVISTDAHSIRGLGAMGCGVLQARRAGLQAADVVNTLPLAALRSLLRSRH